MQGLTRRQALTLGAAIAGSALIAPTIAFAKPDDAMAEIMKFTGGATPSEGRVSLTLPEIAENGNTVPIGVTVESPMTADNYVKRVLIVADGNPRAGVAVINFSKYSGVAEASTRMRMAKTQNVIAVAEMSDGSFHVGKRQVKVTIGGCGG